MFTEGNGHSQGGRGQGDGPWGLQSCYQSQSRQGEAPGRGLGVLCGFRVFPKHAEPPSPSPELLQGTRVVTAMCSRHEAHVRLRRVIRRPCRASALLPGNEREPLCGQRGGGSQSPVQADSPRNLRRPPKFNDLLLPTSYLAREQK